MIRGIQHRSVVAMMLVIALTTATYGVVAFVVSERVEDTLLNTMVERESDFLSELIRSQRVIELPQSLQTRAWFERSGHAHLPAALAQLPLGITHEVALGNELFHVQRSKVAGGVLTVALEITALEAREHEFQLVMIVGGLLVSGMALLAAVGLSIRVAAPITRLSRELKELKPDDLGRRFASRYQGAEIQGIAEALDNYMERMGRMVERERGFAASASHEIRSPLMVIRSALELVDLDPSVGDKTRQTLQRAQRSATSLGMIMDGLFELAREPGSTAAEPIDVVPLVQRVLEEAGVAPGEHGRVDWRAPPTPLMLRVSPAHWRILVRNLVENALNHAPAGSVILRLDGAAFTVRDHGPGIDPELMPRLFERQQRGSHSRGAGLGLYIAQELSARYGWSLQVSNESDGGCSFRVAFHPDAPERSIPE